MIDILDRLDYLAERTSDVDGRQTILDARREIKRLEATITDYLSDADQDTTAYAMYHALTGADMPEVERLRDMIE